MNRKINGKTVKVSAEEETLLREEWALKDIEREKTLYSRNRASEYPTLVDQLDMLYHDMEAGNMPVSPTWFAAIKAVKDQHPKPE